MSETKPRSALDRRMQGRLFARSLFLQAGWSFEGMQNMGFAYAIKPWLDRCYPQAQDNREALARHQELFNTQPYMAGLVLGTVCALERDAAALPKDQRQPAIERIHALKRAAAAALAGIGDALFWATLRPFCAALALACGAALWPFFGAAAIKTAVAAYLLAYNIPVLYIRWNGIRWGCEWKDQIGAKLKSFPWQAWIRRLRAAGLALVLAGAAAALAAQGACAQARLGQVLMFCVFLAAKKFSMPTVTLYAGVCALGALAAAAGWT